MEAALIRITFTEPSAPICLSSPGFLSQPCLEMLGIWDLLPSRQMLDSHVLPQHRILWQIGIILKNKVMAGLWNYGTESSINVSEKEK